MARKSLQDRIRQRKQSNFVGRESQLGLFRKTVQNPQIEEGDRCFDQLIFNIWGQGGVGKSTLLGQFQQIARGAGFAVVSMDEGIKALPEMLGRFAEQLARQGLVMRSFSERYKTYREKREELFALYLAFRLTLVPEEQIMCQFSRWTVVEKVRRHRACV